MSLICSFVDACRTTSHSAACSVSRVANGRRSHAHCAIHVECSKAYFDTTDILDRMRKLTPSLTDEDAGELTRLLAVEKPAPPKNDDDDKPPEGANGAAP